MSDKDKIDLNNLTQRELLIKVYDTTKRLDERFQFIETKQTAQEVKIAVIKTKLAGWSMMWGSIAGLLAGIVAALTA